MRGDDELDAAHGTLESGRRYRAREGLLPTCITNTTETFVAMGMDVTVNRRTSQIAVEKVWCAHDCGQIINPTACARRSRIDHPDVEPYPSGGVKFDRTRDERQLDELSDPALRPGSENRDRVARPSERSAARRQRKPPVHAFLRRSAMACSTRLASGCGRSRWFPSACSPLFTANG